jgi:hypothetical protein
LEKKLKMLQQDYSQAVLLLENLRFIEEAKLLALQLAALEISM